MRSLQNEGIDQGAEHRSAETVVRLAGGAMLRAPLSWLCSYAAILAGFVGAEKLTVRFSVKINISGRGRFYRRQYWGF